MDEHFVGTRTHGQQNNLSVSIRDSVAVSDSPCPSVFFNSLPKKEFIKKFGKETFNLLNHLEKTPESCSFDEAVRGICTLRKLHKQMDELVLEAYGWHIDSDTGSAINLKHDFYEVEYLPENDRVRYTIPSEVRKEILKRLLLLNHKIYAEEVEQGLHDKKKSKPRKTPKKKVEDNTQDLFGFGGDE